MMAPSSFGGGVFFATKTRRHKDAQSIVM